MNSDLKLWRAVAALMFQRVWVLLQQMKDTQHKSNKQNIKKQENKPRTAQFQRKEKDSF